MSTDHVIVNDLIKTERMTSLYNKKCKSEYVRMRCPKCRGNWMKQINKGFTCYRCNYHMQL